MEEARSSLRTSCQRTCTCEYVLPLCTLVFQKSKGMRDLRSAVRSKLPHSLLAGLVLVALVVTGLPPLLTQAASLSAALTPVADATVRSIAPNMNFGHENTLSVEYQSAGQISRALIRFNLAASLPPNAIIESAWLNLNQEGGQGEGSLAVSLVTQNWIEGQVTWNNQPAVGGPVLSRFCDSSSGVKGLDITDIVRAWHNVPHYGLQLRGPEGGAAYIRLFESREQGEYPPTLSVIYHLPAPTPAPTAPPTAAPTPPPTQAPTPAPTEGPAQGWCCIDGEVFQTTQTACSLEGGLFFETAEEAYQACEPQPTEGWCCLNGEVFPTSEDVCFEQGGQFFETEEEAYQTCEPQPTEGWCCLNGEVFPTSKDVCFEQGGQFFETEEEAYQACEPQPHEGWCCLNGEVFPAMEPVCSEQGGLFFETEEEALHLCQPDTPDEVAGPDLVVTDVWQQDGTICYQVRNAGNQIAQSGHSTALLIDGRYSTSDRIQTTLEPDDRLTRCFTVDWTCTRLEESISVRADHNDYIAEGDETNNQRNETWPCDDTAPQIVSGPWVSGITQNWATISWETNEPSDSVVTYGSATGYYPDQEQDPSLVVEHTVPLGGLDPGTLYHFTVLSTDPNGNTVASGDSIFETLPPPDDAPPTVTVTDPGTCQGRVTIGADAHDDTGVDKVEFYIGDELVFTDYSPPYEFVLDSEQYPNGKHDLTGKAIDVSGKSSADGLDIDVDNPVDKSAPTVTITEPKQDDTVSGKVMVKAKLQDDTGLAHAFFKVDGQSEAYEGLTGNPKQKDVVFEWDATSLATGKYRLAIEAFDKDGKYGYSTVDVSLTKSKPTPSPKLKVTGRTVTRTQNHFKVSLTIENTGDDTARNVVVQDLSRSFQPISGYTYFADVEVGFTPSSMYGEAVITSIITLSPKDKATYEYTLVPVLVHPNPPTPSIGDTVKLSYSGADGKEYLDEIKAPAVKTTDGDTIPAAYDKALNSADYLLVTYPQMLFWRNSSSEDVDDLLDSMAQLARYKLGVLGYVDVYDANSLRNLIKNNGKWSSKLQSGWATNGYLLIVGETEIVPSWKKVVGTGLTTKGDYTWKPLTDYPYASTYGGDIRPELSMGRVIGNDAKHLKQVIDTSLNVYLQTVGYGFDWSNVLLMSGKSTSQAGTNPMDFKGQVNTVSKEISKTNPSCTQFKIHTPDFPQYAVDSVIFSAITGEDIIFLAGHGNSDHWDAIQNTDVMKQLSPFRSSNPVVFASSCKTGFYSGAFCLGEAFLAKDAAAYLGATASGGWTAYSQRFFQKWGKGEPVGLAVKQAKRSLGSGLLDNIWSSIYHLYGDPKYGAFVTLLGGASNASSGQSETPSSGVIKVPGFQATQIDGVDYVDIPGGDVLFQTGAPLVPIYRVYYDYPAGYQIQNVTLESVSEPASIQGLNLPIPDVVPFAGSELPHTVPQREGMEWWPEKSYEWTVFESPNTTTLAITVFPFIYNSLTSEATFSTDYNFSIDYTVSDTDITKIETDKSVYEPGEQVSVSLELESEAAEAKDVVVNALIREEGTDELVSSLAFGSLKDMKGKASCSTAWDSTGFESGYYVVAVELMDSEGTLLDRAYEVFRLGTASGQVTGFTAQPQSCSAGETITFIMSFKNMGSTDISGTAVVALLDEDGTAIAEFTEESTRLAPGTTATVSQTWETSGAEPGSYEAVCYVLYDGQATSPSTVAVTIEPASSCPAGLVAGITAAMTILAVGLVVLLRTRRRSQIRHAGRAT